MAYRNSEPDIPVSPEVKQNENQHEKFLKKHIIRKLL